MNIWIVNYSSYEDELYSDADLFTTEDGARKRFNDIVMQIRSEAEERNFNAPTYDYEQTEYHVYSENRLIELRVTMNCVSVDIF